jgi:hypothetical protein
MRFIHCPDDEGKSAPLKHWSTSTSLNGTISQKADIPSLVTSIYGKEYGNMWANRNMVKQILHCIFQHLKPSSIKYPTNCWIKKMNIAFARPSQVV